MNPIFPLSLIKKHSLIWAISLGWVLCLFQIGFTWLFAPKNPVPANQYFRMHVLDNWDVKPGNSALETGYKRFNNWDSLRFFEIAQNGFHIPKHNILESDIHQYRANVTTPPAYPLAVHWIQRIFRLPGEIALLVTAQLACWIFWIYFILILIESRVPSSGILLSAFTVAVHPASFYLVVGYTESLFMASFMGLIYWTNRWAKSRHSTTFWFLAASHGFIGAATRFAGFPIAVYPIAQAIIKGRNKLLSGALLSLFVIFGLISFFIYSYFKFGKWDLYFSLTQLGWGLSSKSGYWAIFNPMSYIPLYFFEDTMASINRTAVPWSLGLIILSWSLDRQKTNRMGLYCSAFALLYAAMIGKAGSNMDGMIRYTLPAFVPIILCITQVLNTDPSYIQTVLKSKVRWILLAGYLLAIATQGWMAWRFLHGRWVS